ncbi:hypothetical protein DVH24_013760 [Malus domestica]|uniref:Uncharacterized protein n=1 Tax=Malus domestica TaxID=3750 RepID=A0A498JGL1_MALDO|nr:hypothetical protein DVH24_013760 [Malus domestica]
MGQILDRLQGKQWRRKQIRRITDKVSNHFKNETGRANLNFEDLYIVISISVYSVIFLFVMAFIIGFLLWAMRHSLYRGWKMRKQQELETTLSNSTRVTFNNSQVIPPPISLSPSNNSHVIPPPISVSPMILHHWQESHANHHPTLESLFFGLSRLLSLASFCGL